MPFEKRELFYLLALVAIGAFLRFYRLAEIPPGFHFDQAFYVFDAIRLLQGEFHIFFPAPGGSEPLYVYLATVGVALFGVSAIGLKITSAMIGTIFIPAVYGFTRTFLHSRFAAAVAGALATISVWLIFYSRNGERVEFQALLALLTLWFFWRALANQKTRDVIYTGIVLGLALYTYPAARVLPILLCALTAYFIVFERAPARRFLKGIAIILGIAALMFLPLGVYYSAHPEQFISHSAEVSIFSPTAEQKNIALALGDNALRILKMFFVKGDSGIIRNVPGRPVFDWLVAPLFIVGVMVAGLALLPTKTKAERLNHTRAVFLFAWIGLALAISLISDDAPNFGRVFQSAPALFVITAWGAMAVRAQLRTPTFQRIGAAVLIVLLLASGVLAFRDYFLIFGNSQALYYAYDADKVEIANWVNAQAKTNRVFLAPLYYQQGTVSLLTRNSLLDSFDSRDTIILPAAVRGDAVYAFPPEQDKRLETLAARMGNLGQRETLTGTLGTKLLGIYRVPASNLPDTVNPLQTLESASNFLQPQQQANATWADNFELIGYSVDASDALHRNLMVTLFLHALKPAESDYTFSVKAADDQQRVWGQEDKWTGDNSYATSQYQAGDLIVERFYPGLDACAPAGTYHLTVEAYNPKTGQPLTLNQGGVQFSLGTQPSAASKSNRPEDLEPEQAVSVKVASGFLLSGFTLTPADLQADQDFSLALFWQGNANAGAQSLRIHFQDMAGRDFELAQAQVTPPPPGRGLCSFFDLHMPADAAPGAGSFFVNTAKIAEVELER